MKSDLEKARERRKIAESINRLAKQMGEHGGRPDYIEGFPGLSSPEALRMRAFPPSQLPETVAGRLEMVQEWLTPRPILDEDGEPTGEFSEPLITKEQARKLLEGIE